MHAYNHSRLVGTVGRSLLHNVDMWQYRHNCCNIGRTRDRLGQMQGKCNQLCPLAGSVGIYHSSRSAEGARLVVCNADRLSCVVGLVECVVGWTCSRCYQLVHLGCHAARAKTKKQVSGVSLLKIDAEKKCPRSPGPPASNAPKIVQGNIANTLISLLDEKKQQQILCFFYQNHQKRPRGVPLPSTLIIFYQNDPYDLITQGIIKEIMPKDHLLMKISLTAAITPKP